MSTATGEWFWDACGRNRCVVCGPRKASSIAGAIGVAEPARFVRFSLVGATWQQARARLFRVRYDIRSAGFAWEDCYSVEANPRGTGWHAHLFQHGDYVPQRRLQELCHRRGMGYPDIRAWHPTSERAYGYGLKIATGYGLKGASRSETLHAYLDLNGGRLVHASRNFWREGDRRLKGLDAARRVWRERRYGVRPYVEAEWRFIADAA